MTQTVDLTLTIIETAMIRVALQSYAKRMRDLSKAQRGDPGARKAQAEAAAAAEIIEQHLAQVEFEATNGGEIIL